MTMISYGFILLDGNSDDGFGWSTEMTSEDLNKCNVTVCGFPEDKPKGSMWITGGEISRATDRHMHLSQKHHNFRTKR